MEVQSACGGPHGRTGSIAQSTGGQPRGPPSADRHQPSVEELEKVHLASGAREPGQATLRPLGAHIHTCVCKVCAYLHVRCV